MATLLNDKEISKLIGIVIIDGDATSVRPNSYVLRLGTSGEFINAAKEFELGKKKKGIRIQPGHSVAVTAFETLDFSRETVHKIYPGKDLHAIISPSTDLSREGIVASTTQVDAGFHGTLNWTLTNTASAERRFLFKERIYRLTIFLLNEGETPESIYTGDYQDKIGYVRSERKGAPVGMRDDEWADAIVEEGPEQLLDNLLRSGYPWHALGQRLKMIDQQFKSVSNEYSEIKDTLDKLETEMKDVGKNQNEIEKTIHKVIKETLNEQGVTLQNRWLINTGAMIVTIIGLITAIVSNDTTKQFVCNNSWWIGLILIIAGIIVLVVTSRRR